MNDSESRPRRVALGGRSTESQLATMEDEYVQSGSDISWTAPYIAELKAVARGRHARLHWVMDVNDVFHSALLRWATKQVSPEEGEPLSERQLKTFSLACRNVLVDELRAIARRRKLLQAAAQLTRDREALPTSTISDRDFLEWALRVLDRPTRELLRMHYCQQLSYADIAKRTGTKVNTVRQQHKRAIDKLRRLLGYERRP